MNNTADSFYVLLMGVLGVFVFQSTYSKKKNPNRERCVLLKISFWSHESNVNNNE